MNAIRHIAIPASVWIGGLWLRASLVGALLVTLGVASLLRPDASALAALATVLAGAALAIGSFVRARRAIDRESPEVATATPRRAGDTASAGTGAAYGRAPSVRSA